MAADLAAGWVSVIMIAVAVGERRTRVPVARIDHDADNGRCVGPGQEARDATTRREMSRVFFRFMHRNWVKATGSVLDSRFHSARDSVVRLAYVVRFTGPDGQSRKLEVVGDPRTFGVNVGATVPLLVSPDGQRAVFDRYDPQINATAVAKRRRSADEERFRNQLDS
jgi:hypothetical protein